MTPASASAPLSGVQVLEIGSTLSGPYCTMLLAQLGADVIKVEPPGGDITRHIGPARSPGMSSTFLALNADKRSVVLDLASGEGRAALRSLVLASDVVVHNMRPSAAAKAGLDPDELRRVHPSVVLCAIQGYPTGSGSEDRPAYDDIIQAGSGMVALQAALTGTPSYVATVMADKSTGMMAALAVTAALHRRDRTGDGTAIEVPMSDVMAATTLVEHLSGAAFEPPIGPPLYARVLSPHRGPYRTADGWISVTIYTPAHWQRFFAHVGHPEVLRDPRFADVSSRAANIDELYAIVAGELRARATGEWLATFEQLDIPAAPIRTVDDILTDDGPGAVVRSELHPSEGALRYLPHPIRYDRVQPGRRRPAPRLGEHTDEVLASVRATGGASDPA